MLFADETTQLVDAEPREAVPDKEQQTSAAVDAQFEASLYTHASLLDV